MRRSSGDDRGFVIVWMAMVLVVLLGVAAFAVDLVHAYAEAQHVARAADAAALAGVVEIPNDPSCTKAPGAKGRAQELATANGMPNDGVITKVTATCTGPNEMTVDIRHSFDTFFARAIGFKRLTVHKTAVAQYDPPVRMGSGANFLYNVPICPGGLLAGPSCMNVPTSFGSGGLWASIMGTDSEKEDGNAVTARVCHSATNSAGGPAGVDMCNLGAGTNLEGDPGGSETYQVHNDGGPVDIWVYDAGFVATQPACSESASAWVTYPDANVLGQYANPVWCTGDSSFGNSAPHFTTTYDVLDAGNNPVGCSTGPIPGFSLQDTIAAGGEPTFSPPNLARGDATAAKYFHQWVRICTTPAAVGDYKVRVTASGGIGANQFSIMALHAGFPSPNLTVFGSQQLPLAAVKTAAGPATFFLAHVLPSKRPRTLALDFFDLGDNSFGVSSGKLTIGETPDVVNPGTGNPAFGAFLSAAASGACSWVAPPDDQNNSSNLLPFADSKFASAPGCAFQYNANYSPTPGPGVPWWNGRWVSVRVTLPAVSDPNGYKCDTSAASTPQDCWLLLQIQPDPGSPRLNDATTWQARIVGAPVRLVG